MIKLWRRRLWTAAQQGRVQDVADLLRGGHMHADRHATDKADLSDALRVAVLNDWAECVLAIVTIAPSLEVRWSTTEFGTFQRPLAVAAHAHSLCTLRALLRLQGLPTGTGSVRMAIQGGSADAVQLLLDAKAALPRDCLCAAAQVGEAGLVRLLLEAKASVHERDSQSVPALVHAASNGQCVQALQLLIGAKADVNANTRSGKRPLSWGVFQGCSADFATALLRAKAQLGRDKGSVLVQAAMYCEPAVVQVLLAAGVSVNSGDEDGFTALRAASLATHRGVGKCLLAAKADVNATSTHGDRFTPLHEAVVWDRACLVAALLAHGANVEGRNYEGATPLHLGRSDAVVQLLVAAKADVNARTLTGQVPEHRICAQLRALAPPPHCLEMDSTMAR